MRSLVMKSCFLGLFLALCFGCGSDDGPSEPAVPAVEGATLSVASTSTLGRVGVNGLPAPAAKRREVSYEIRLAADGVDDLHLVLDHDSEGWFFHAPFHTVTPNDGGAFSVVISDGSAQSASQPLHVAALPAATGAFAATVAKAREYIEQRAEWAGTSIAELKSTPLAEVELALLPLKLSQSYLDSDEDAHDLTELAANADDFLNPEQAALLDRVYGYFDLESLLQMRIDSFTALKATVPEFEHLKNADKLCINARVRIDTAEELSQRMIQSKVAEIGVDPESDAGEIMGFGGKVFGALGVAPGPVGATASAAGALLGTVQAAVGFVAGTLPSYFVSIDFDIDKLEFNEDSTEITHYENVEVVAASTGWSADRSIANVAVNAFGSGLSFADRGQILGSDFLRDLSAAGIGAGADGFFEDTDIIEFCANQWTIDISNPEYCTATSLNHKFDINIPFREIKPREAGQDQVRVAAQSARFGGREIHEDVNMEVKQIQVVCSPDEIYVTELGEDIQIAAEIHHADLTSLRWTPQQGTWNDGILGSDTSSGRTRTLKTPTDTDDYPFFVFVESLSRNGIRASGVPVRQCIATVRNAAEPAITIEPVHACIQPGETQLFAAEVNGVENPTVTWEILDGYGSIDQNGLYTGLSGGTSEATIQATVNEEEDLKGIATVDVRSCVCNLDITITGDSRWRAGSSDVAFLVSDFGDLFYQFFFEIEDEDGALIGASITGDGEGVLAPRPGQTGTWPASFTYSDGAQSWAGIWDEEIPLPAVSVTITELTETFMEGTFHGNAFQLGEDNEITSLVGVEVHFRAGNWALGAWPCGQE